MGIKIIKHVWVPRSAGLAPYAPKVTHVGWKLVDAPSHIRTINFFFRFPLLFYTPTHPPVELFYLGVSDILIFPYSLASVVEDFLGDFIRSFLGLGSTSPTAAGVQNYRRHHVGS